VAQGGDTPLHNAALNGHSEVVKVLLEKVTQADAAAKNNVRIRSERARALPPRMIRPRLLPSMRARRFHRLRAAAAAALRCC
jgi:ankyrin repeat protein